jgi:hypothetical protein
MARRRRILQSSAAAGHAAQGKQCHCGGTCSKCSGRKSAGAAAGPVEHRLSEISVLPRGGVRGQKPAGGQKQPASQQRTPQQMIDDARPIAFGRAFRAYSKVIGLGPPPPPGRPDPAEMDKLEARSLAQKMFREPDPDMDKVAEIVGKIRDRLLPGSFNAQQAQKGDKDCTGRAGYVRGNKPPMVLCPPFFSGSDEQRVRTLIHEAAHLAGIGQPSGESYCADFDCDTSCGDANSADSWAHFIHCLGGGTPDVPTTITAPAPGGTP